MGWPVHKNNIDRLNKKFPNVILIHDKVDSSNVDWSFKKSKVLKNYVFKKSYQIYSLSKSIGLSGGGIACDSDQWLNL